MGLPGSRLTLSGPQFLIINYWWLDYLISEAPSQMNTAYILCLKSKSPNRKYWDGKNW